MKRLSIVVILFLFTTQFASGADTDLYAVLSNPVMDTEFASRDNDTIFTMTVDMAIVNPSIDQIDIIFPDTYGFKLRVEAQFWVRMPVDFEGYYVGPCFLAMTTFSYPQGYTNETKIIHLIFHNLKITELLAGNYTVYLDHPEISLSYNTTMIVNFNETILVQPNPDFEFDTVLLPMDTVSLVIGFCTVYILRKFKK